MLKMERNMCVSFWSNAISRCSACGLEIFARVICMHRLSAQHTSRPVFKYDLAIFKPHLLEYKIVIPYSPVYMADEVAMQNSLVSRQESLAASHS